MAPRFSRAWTFDDQADARTYIEELRRLWGTWLVLLVVLVFAAGLVLVVAGLGLGAAVVSWLRPLQRRAEAIVPEDRVAEGRRSIFGRRSERDLVIRELTYGVEPLRAALAAAGSSPAWVVVRHFVVGATVAGLVMTLIGLYA